MKNTWAFENNDGQEDSLFSDVLSASTTGPTNTVVSSTPQIVETEGTIHEQLTSTNVTEKRSDEDGNDTTSFINSAATATTITTKDAKETTTCSTEGAQLPHKSTNLANTDSNDTMLAINIESLALDETTTTPNTDQRTQSPDQLEYDEESDQQSESLRLPISGARPSFEISVEDPQKIGDAMNAHIVYRVKTKTDSPAFRSSEFVVARRYRDFLWLYNQLTNGNPGVVVPPVPEKHALGRFQDEFVESRRIALERCLQKTVSHPMLYGDPDLKVFLESESFNVEKRQKRAEPETPKLGFMRSFGETISSAASNPFSKFIETDDWFASKKYELDSLETQLKTLLKGVEGVVKQRKELGGALNGFGESVFPLASAELNRNLSTRLTVLGEIQKQLKELHDEQARYDILTLEHTIDEYIRIIGSIRISFNARIRAYQNYQQAESELQKKMGAHDKLKGQQNTKSERLSVAQLEILEMQQKVEELERDYQDISKLIKNELDRFDQEKAMDFKTSVEAFLYSMIDHQKKVIGLWETYFQQTEGLDDESD